MIKKIFAKMRCKGTAIFSSCKIFYVLLRQNRLNMQIKRVKQTGLLLVLASCVLLGIGFPTGLVNSNLFLSGCLAMAIIGLVCYVRAVKKDGRY